jgi:hypothetical protein
MPAGVSAWTPLANITLGSTAASVTFSSISGAYKDLRLVIMGGANGPGGGGCRYTINSDTSSTYLWATAEGNGSAASSAWNGNNYAETFNNYILWGYDSAPNTVVTMDFLDYSATDKHKTILTRGNNAVRPATNMMAVRWPSTAAINTISFSANGASFLVGSTFALYGVSA